MSRSKVCGNRFIVCNGVLFVRMNVIKVAADVLKAGGNVPKVDIGSVLSCKNVIKVDARLRLRLREQHLSL
jgi:hypothetical protein